MWMMLQQDKPDDFVLATGETHSVREFVEKAFAHVGISIEWKGKRGTVNEVGVDKHYPDHILVKVDPDYFRPTEVSLHDRGKTSLGADTGDNCGGGRGKACQDPLSLRHSY